MSGVYPVLVSNLKTKPTRICPNDVEAGVRTRAFGALEHSREKRKLDRKRDAAEEFRHSVGARRNAAGGAIALLEAIALLVGCPVAVVALPRGRSLFLPCMINFPPAANKGHMTAYTTVAVIDASASFRGHASTARGNDVRAQCERRNDEDCSRHARAVRRPYKTND